MKSINVRKWGVLSLLVFLHLGIQAQDSISQAKDSVRIPSAQSGNSALNDENTTLIVMFVLIVALLVVWVFMRSNANKRRSSYKSKFK